MKSLYVLTAQFPFGVQENFLETEVEYLSKKFDRVVFIPLGGQGSEQRNIPENCSTDTSLFTSRKKKLLKSLKGFPYIFPTFLKLFFEDKVYCDLKRFRKWLFSLVMCSYYRQSKIVCRLLKDINEQDVIYSYWGADYNAILPFFAGRAKLVSRFHGDWDLWQSITEEGYNPNRRKLMQCLDAAIPISYKGENFLRNLYPYAPLKTIHLGSLDCGVCAKSSDGKLRVLSCSTVYPLKRVSLIFEALSKIPDIDIEWTHIGDGPTFEELNEKVRNANTTLKSNLLGKFSLPEVLTYYKEHPVDVFINLSTNEGIPVSIMEAISFNVPVVATNVGANSEIVTEETGLLLSPNPSLEEISKAIHEIIKMNLRPRLFWDKEFNAEKNYSKFADYIYNL